MKRTREGGEGRKEVEKMRKYRGGEDRWKEVWRWVQRDDGRGGRVRTQMTNELQS